MTEHEVIIEFELKDDKITNNTDKIIEAFKQIKSSFSGNVDKPISEGLAEMAEKSEKASKPLKEIKKSTKGAALVMGVLATKAGIYTKKAIQLAQGSAEFIGTQTKFNAIFDKTNGELEKAQQWVDNYSKSLMLDNKVVMDTVSNFKLFANTLGLSNEKAKEITFNMTQLAHDMAAVAGVDVSTMAQKINSALAGQTKALKEYGISLDSNSLQQTLYQNNIKRTVASLNSAEKAELIYVQIMKQTAGQQGYLAKTMLSPANAANIVKTQFTLLGRSIGNLVLPILMKLLPVVVALTQALTKMATALASFFGIKIDFSDYNADIGGISGGIDGIGDSADGASKKIKNMLRDFDDLHVVDFGDDSGSGGSVGGGVGGAGGLNLDVQQYADWSKYLEGVTDKLSQAEGIVSAIDGLLAGLTIGGIVGKVLELIGVLDKGKGKALALSTALLGLGIKISFDAQKDILNNGLNADNIVKTILGSITAGAGTYFTAILLGANPGLALTLALVVTLSLAAINFLTPIAEKVQEFTLSHFGGYGKAVGQRYSESMAEGIEINGRKVPIKINQMLINTNEVAQSNLATLETNVTGTSSRLVDRLNTDFSQIETTINTSTENSKDTAIKAFDSMNKKINDDGISMNESVKNNFNSIRNIVNQSTSGSSQDAQKNFSAINSYADSYFKDTRYKIEGGITGAEKTFTTSVGGMTQNMNSAKTLITDSSKTMADDLKTNLADGSMGLETLSKDSKTYSDEVKKNLSSISDAKVKTPKFSWSLATKAVGTVAKVLAALSMPTLLPTLSVSWYADGGFPNKGDLFIANEREPELIGTMGNKTTVANSVQIIEGIAQASYNGMKRALQEVDFGSGDTLVYVGNKQLTDVVTKQQRMNNKKYGR